MCNQVEDLNKKIKNLELQKQGAIVEYEYILKKEHEKTKKAQEEFIKSIENLKEKSKCQDNTIKKQNEIIEYYKKEFEEAVKKMERYKDENERIKNSRWWKLREKLKGYK